MQSINTINLPIDDRAYSYARIYSSLLSEEYQRKRAYASILALFAFLNILEKKPLNIQKSMTLFRNPVINEQYEIADLYVNNWHLDVRVVSETDAVLVPKIHYENDIEPDFYVVVKVDSQLKNAELVGFIDTENNNNEAFDYHYYKVPFSALIGYDEFLEKIKTEKQEKHSDADHKLFENSYLSLMDGGLDTSTRIQVLKHLFKCSECRTEFCCFTGFEMVSCNINKYPDILDDKTLDIIGAQSVNDTKYEGKEETIYIGDDNNTDVEADINQNDNEGNVTDILDELFNEEDLPIVNKSTSDLEVINNEETQNLSSESSDLEVIKDDNVQQLSELNSDMEIIPETDNDLNENSNLEFIQEDTESVIEQDISNISDISDNSDSDFEIIEEDTSEELTSVDNKDDIEIINDDNLDSESNIEPLEDTNIEEIKDNSDFVVINEEEENPESDIDLNETENIQSVHDEVQKVIVDYDDTGEPVYSYITSVNQEEAGSVISDFEPVIEDDKEETFEEYPEENSDTAESDEFVDLDSNIQQDSKIDDNYAPMQNIYDSEVVKPEEISGNDEQFEDNNQSNEEIENQDYDDSEYSEDTEETQEYSEDDTESDEEEYEEYEDYEEPNNNKSSNKSLLVILSCIIAFGLIGGGAFFFAKSLKQGNKTASVPVETVSVPDAKTTNDMFEQPVGEDGGLEIPVDSGKPIEQDENTAQNNQQENNPPENNPPEVIDQNDIPVPLRGTIPVPATAQGPTSDGDISKAIANAFNQPYSGVSLKSLNWFCTAELFTDPSFKNYLQNLDNTLKQNIKNNIMGVTQTPPNDTVAAKFAVDNNGNLKKVIISDSSGSQEIDNIVLQSIKETFEGEKSQILTEGTLKSDMYYLKVVINL